MFNRGCRIVRNATRRILAKQLNLLASECETPRSVRRARETRLRFQMEALEARTMFAAGDVDAAFGVSGYVTTDYGTGTSAATQARASVVQADGKWIATGENGLARFNTDGSLDATFGDNGIVVYPYFAKSIALQANGSLVIAGGTSGTGSDHFVVSRYLSNGTPDSSFDSDGHALIDFGAGTETANGVTVQANGRIVVVGVSDRSLAVARLLTTGALDPAFDGDGMLTRQLYTTANVANAVTVQPNGKILISGSTWQYSASSSNYDAFVLRLHSGGALDRTFNNTGVTYINVGRYDDAKSMTLLADGRILVSGSSNANFRSNLLLARLNSDGVLDTSFSDDGVATEVISGFSNENLGGEAHLIQADGSVIGTAGGRLLTFNSDGLYQPSAFTSVFGFQMITSLKADADQKLLLSGTAFSRFAVGRLNPDRSYDNSFSGDGVYSLSIGASDDIAGRSVIQSDGKLVVPSTSQGTFAVTRYKADGTLDTTFSADGKVVIDLGSQYLSARATAIAIQSDGRLIVAGQVNKMGLGINVGYLESDLAMVRLNQDGTIDSTFGVNGIVVTSLGGYASANVVKIQSDGRILLGGFGSGGYISVVRYLPSGDLDRTFSGDGIFTATGVNISYSSINDIAIQPDGKIVAVGEQSPYVTNVFPSNMVVMRLNTNGTLDRTFGTNGRIRPASLMRSVARVLLDTDGSILVGGNALRYQNQSLTSQMVLTRYSSSGEFLFEYPVQTFEEPYSFNPTQSYPVNATLKSMAIQADGKILLAGTANRSPVVVRVNPDGTTDSSFNADGRSKLNVPSPGTYVSSDLLVQASGKVLLVGSYRVDGQANQDIMLARVLTASPTGPAIQVSLNGSGQIEIRDRWSRNDVLVVKQIGDQLEISDYTTDSNAVFSVTDLPAITGNGTKTIQIPLSLIQQTEKPLLLNTLAGDDMLALHTSAGDDATVSITYAAGAGTDNLSYSSSSLSSVWKVNATGSGTLTPTGLAARAFSQVEDFKGSEMADDFRVVAGHSDRYLAFDGNNGLVDSLQVSGDANLKVTNNLLAVTGGLTQNLMQYRFEKLILQGGISDNILDASGFAGASVLIGAAGDDLLISGSGSDELRGGPGNDILYGGEGDDRLFGDDGNDFLSGDGGNDTLYGGNGRDILVGGFGADVLRGGLDQDILIAGYVAGVYQPNDSMLQRLLRDAWADLSLSYEARIDLLLVQGIGPTSFKLTPDVNVFDDFGLDQLFGDAELDWFFANVGGNGIADVVNGRLQSELLSPLKR